MPRSMWVLCLVLTLAFSAAPARADLVLSIGSTSISPGGTGTIDVYLTSNASAASPDLINFYGFQLQITNDGTDGTQLAFSTSQNFGYISNTSLNPAYVFLGDSFDACLRLLRSGVRARRCIPTTRSPGLIPLSAATRSA